MTVDAFHHNLHSIDIKPVFRTEFYRTESDTLLMLMKGTAFCIEQFQGKEVEIRSLRCPGTDLFPPGIYPIHGSGICKCEEPFFGLIATIRKSDCSRQPVTRTGTGQINIRLQFSIGRSVDRNPSDMFFGLYLEPHRTINPPKQPPVGLALGGIDGFICRMFIDAYFQLVLSTHIQQVGDIIRETIKSALMNRAGRKTVDKYFRIRHHPVKDNPYRMILIRFRHLERMPVNSGLHTGILHSFLLIPTPVSIRSEALQLPL